MRSILVHYHIFKNAGSSVDSILKKSFGDGWASLEGATATSLLRSSDLYLFVKDRPGILAVSSHLLRPPAPAFLNVLPIVLIRHPLDRAFSVYSQLRRNAGDLPSELIAREAGFPQFVLWCLNNKSLGGMVIVNYQVIHLSDASFRHGHIYDAVATQGDLWQAIDYLSNGPCCGTTDCFDAVMTRLRSAAKAVDLHIIGGSAAENITNGRPRDFEERLSGAEQQLGATLLSQFLQENELDYHLYAWAYGLDARAATYGDVQGPRSM